MIGGVWLETNEVALFYRVMVFVPGPLGLVAMLFPFLYARGCIWLHPGFTALGTSATIRIMSSPMSGAWNSVLPAMFNT